MLNLGRSTLSKMFDPSFAYGMVSLGPLDFFFVRRETFSLDNQKPLIGFPGYADVFPGVGIQDARKLLLGIFPLPGDPALDLNNIFSAGARTFPDRNLFRFF